MLDLESEQMRLSAEKAEPAANHQPTTKEPSDIARLVNCRKSQNEALYGPAPILPFESEERYEKINDWLKPSFGGHLSRFEHISKRRWSTASGGAGGGMARRPP